MAGSPPVGGFLSGKFRRDGPNDEGRRSSLDFPPVERDRTYGILDVLDATAARRGWAVP
jgi:aryl-alcohol dehydrogenase-like predicted oxidoreductase